VIPILGPSDIRDTGGLVIDGFSTVYPWFVDFIYTISARAVDVVNARSLYLKEVDEAKAASVDYYAAVRNAFVQRRKSQVNDGETSKEESEDLYSIDKDIVE
jgi:phospholipid-binding lipoprotein MlaA